MLTKTGKHPRINRCPKNVEIKVGMFCQIEEKNIMSQKMRQGLQFSVCQWRDPVLEAPGSGCPLKWGADRV